MENFNEFDTAHTVPQKSSGAIIGHAFDLYKKGIGYALLLVLALIVGYMVIGFIAKAVSGFNPFLMSEMLRSGDMTSMNMWEIPGYSSYNIIQGLLGLVLFPLYAGLIYIFNKLNFNETVEISDLFIGYKQNTVQLIVLGFLTSVIMLISIMLCVIPFFFVAPLLFISLPIVFFENVSAMDGIKKSFNIVKNNYGAIWVVAVLAALISIAGIILCGVGILVTFPFAYAAIYSTYCAYLGAPRPIISKA